MRVCFVIESSGGSGIAALDLAQGLVRAGDQVLFIYSPLRADEIFCERIKEEHDIEFAQVPISYAVGLNDIISFFKLFKIIWQRGPFDILHAHSSKAGGLVRALGLFFRKAKVVYTPHAFVTMAPGCPWIYRLLEQWLAPLCSKIIAVAAVEKTHGVEVLKIPPEKIDVIPHGIVISETTTREEVRKLKGWKDEDIVLGFVGRFVPQKNVCRLIRAFGLIEQTSAGPYLAIVGDGPERPFVEKEVEARDLKERVFFLSQCDARLYISGFDALVCSSNYEGFPLVFLEALTFGVPVITTPVGGAQETVIEGVTGFVSDAFSSATLAEKIKEYVALPQNKKEEMAVAARAHAARFTVDEMVRSVRQLYLTCLKGNA